MEHQINYKCKGAFVLKTETMIHTIFGKKIKIHNVPYLHCEICGEEEYVAEHKVNILLRDAYRDNLSEINYE